MKKLVKYFTGDCEINVTPKDAEALERDKYLHGQVWITPVGDGSHRRIDPAKVLKD